MWLAHSISRLREAVQSAEDLGYGLLPYVQMTLEEVGTFNRLDDGRLSTHMSSSDLIGR
jgi:hypothetical protein